MKAYVWCNGVITQGFSLLAEFGKRKEPVLVLGKAGVGSHYEALCLHREKPPKIESDKIAECDLSFMPATREEGFYLLRESKREGVLLRVDTFSNHYPISGNAYCEAASGKPKRLSTGSVFDKFLCEDAIWEMHAGDVLRIRGCLPQGASYALWLDENMQPHSACFREYLAYVASKRSIIEKEKLACASVYNWRAGNLSRGMTIRKTDFGAVAVFGNGPFAEFLPVVDSSSAVLKNAALVDMSGPKDQVYGLVALSNPQENLFLLSVSTEGFKSKNSKGNISVWKGSPEIIVSAKCGEDFDESLVLMREGDVLCIEPQGDHEMITYAVFVKDGKLVQEQGLNFKKLDMSVDPIPWQKNDWFLLEDIPNFLIGVPIDCYGISYDRILSSRYGLDCYSYSLKSRGILKAVNKEKGSIVLSRISDNSYEFECSCNIVSPLVFSSASRRLDKNIDYDVITRTEETQRLLLELKEAYDSCPFHYLDTDFKEKIETVIKDSAISKRPIYSLTEKKSASLSGDGSLPEYCRYLRNLIAEIGKLRNFHVERETKNNSQQNKQKKIKSELTTVTPVMHSGQMAAALKKAGII